MDQIKEIDYENSSFFDVDDTLVMWTWPEDQESKAIYIEDELGIANKVVPHLPHIQEIKDHHKAGHRVVVWSQGGRRWAECVVKALKLDEYVNEAMAKPLWYYDDFTSESWLGKPLYRDPWTGNWVGAWKRKERRKDKDVMIKQFFAVFKQLKLEKNLLLDEIYVLKKKLEEK